MLHHSTTKQNDPLRRRERPPNRSSRTRLRFQSGILFRAVCLAAGALVIAYVLSPLIWNAERMRPGLETALSAQLGRETRIGSLKFTAGLGAVVATDVMIADDPAFGSAPFVQAHRVKFAIERLPLIFHNNIAVRAIDVDQAEITMIRGVDRKWNVYGILAGDATAVDAIPPRVRLSAVTLTIRGGDRGEPFVLRDLAFDSPAFSTTTESAFTLSATVAGGGSLKFSGKAGPVAWNRGTLNVPMNGLVNAKEVAINESHLTAALAPAMEGLLSVDANIESDGNNLQVMGSARVAQLKLATLATPDREVLAADFSLQHDLDARSGTLARCDFQLEKGSASMTGRYAEVDGRTVVKFDVTGRGVSVTPMAELLPAVSLPLPAGASLQGGVGSMDLVLQGPLEHPTTVGSIVVNNTRLIGFNLEERLSSVTGLDLLHIDRDLEISAFDAHINAGPGKISVESIDVTMPGIGVFSGRGEIGDDRTIEFRMNAIRSGVAEKHPIPFVVRGACTAPIFRQPGKVG